MRGKRRGEIKYQLVFILIQYHIQIYHIQANRACSVALIHCTLIQDALCQWEMAISFPSVFFISCPTLVQHDGDLTSVSMLEKNC
jgi:hypothetical protein